MEKMICISEEEYQDLIYERNLYKRFYYEIKKSIIIDMGGAYTSKLKKGYNYISIKQNFLEELFDTNLECDKTTLRIQE